MTQKPKVEREERRKEIERNRAQNPLEFLQGTATAQAIAHPLRSFHQFWDENNLPGIAKAPLGIADAALHGIGDVASTTQEFGRAITGNVVYALEQTVGHLPGNDQAEVQRVRDAYERTPGGLFEKGRAANEAFAQGNEFLAGVANMAFDPTNIATAGGGALAKFGIASGIRGIAPVARGITGAADISNAIQNLPLKPFTYVGGKLVRQVIDSPQMQARLAKLAGRLTPVGKAIVAPGAAPAQAAQLAQQVIPTSILPTPAVPSPPSTFSRTSAPPGNLSQLMQAAQGLGVAARPSQAEQPVSDLLSAARGVVPVPRRSTQALPVMQGQPLLSTRATSAEDLARRVTPASPLAPLVRTGINAVPSAAAPDIAAGITPQLATTPRTDIPFAQRLTQSGAGAAGGGVLGGGVGAVLPADTEEQRQENIRKGAITGGVLGGVGAAGLAARFGDELTSGITPQLAQDYAEQAVQRAGGQNLGQLLPPADAQELRALFPTLSDERLAATIHQGRQNAPADNFAAMINANWDRAKAGQLSAHDIINAYIPAVLSQRRGALSVEATLENARTGGFGGTPIPEEVLRGLIGGKGGDTGKYRPEDLAALMMHYAPEGRDLGSALRYGDPQAVQTAIDNFNARWPHAGFMPGAGGDIRTGERGALVQAAHDDAFSSLAGMINKMAVGGMSGDEIAQVMRDWTAGAATARRPRAVAKQIASLYNDPRLPQAKNWGAIIDRIANGKSGFLTTNLGGPSATFDVRVQKAMKPGATIEDYQRALDIMYPGEDPGLQHHKFWDAQDYTETPHLGLLKSVEQIAQGRTYDEQGNVATGLFESPQNLTPQLAQDLGKQKPRRVKDQVAGLPLTPPLNLAQQERSKYQQKYLNDPTRVAADIAANREKSREAYIAKNGSDTGFDDLWTRLNDWIEQTKVISMGVGDAKSARAIIKSGQPISNGMARHGVQPGQQDFPLSLVDAKAKALGLDKDARLEESLAYGAAKNIHDPEEAIREYARYFLRLEAGSFGKLGLGDPTKVPNAVNAMYASVHEGQPALQQMGGGIHFLVNPQTTEYTTAVHHPFAFESPSVLAMHEGTPTALKETFTPEKNAAAAVAAGREPIEPFGPQDQYTISGSPYLVGPAATNAARAAALIMSDGGKNLALAANGDVERAAALLARGDPGQARGFSIAGAAKANADAIAEGRKPYYTPGVGYDLAQSSSLKRTEAMVHNLTPENITGVVVKGNTVKSVAENAQAARNLMAHYGIDAPIYVAWGPEGEPNPGLYELTDQGPVLTSLNAGRQKLIETVKGLGEKDLGAAPVLAATRKGMSPGAWLTTPLMTGVPGGNRLAMMGSTGVVGAGVGAALPADTEEDRLRNAQQGAVLGAGLAGGLTSGKATTVITKLPIMKELGGALWKEALVAQRAAMARPSQGIGKFSTLASVWKVQLTSTLRNLLQDEATARLWLKDAGVRLEMMNQNHASMMQLYIRGERDPYKSLPTNVTSKLDALGRTGVEPDVGASFLEENKKIVDLLSAMDLARAGAGLSLIPGAGGVPVAGVALKAGTEFFRPFQQAIFDRLNGFTRAASRYAVFEDTLDKELPGVANKLLDVLESRGGNKAALAKLRARDGYFSPAEVEGVFGGAGDAWKTITDDAVVRAQDRAKNVLGDYGKEIFPGEKQLGKVVPFSSYALRATPRTLQMLSHHPGFSLLVMLAMVKGIQHGQQAGLPGYLAGSIPVDQDTPVLGGVASAMTGGAPGKMYIDPASITSPFGAELFAGGDMPTDATPYQQITNLMGRFGYSTTPVIQQAMAAMNQDYRLPGGLSRTAAVEQTLPGPTLPSLTQGPTNFLRQQFGGSPLTATSLDRQKAEIFYRLTGVPLNDPSVKRDPRLAALVASTLDPESPLSVQALKEERLKAGSRTIVGTSSPFQVSARSDVQRTGDEARVAQAALPPAQYDPAEIKALQQAPDMNSHLRALAMIRANRGTQGAPSPETSITSGASGSGRAYAILAAWEQQHSGTKQAFPAVYARQLAELRKQLGLP